MIKLSDGRRLLQLHRILPDHLARFELPNPLRGGLSILKIPLVQLTLCSAQPELRQQLRIGPRVAELDRGRSGQKTGDVLARLELRSGEIEEQECPRGVCFTGELVLLNC